MQLNNYYNKPMYKATPLYLLLILIISGPVHAYQATDVLPAYSTEYSPERDVFKDGADAIKLATSTNRRILIKLGGDWCVWCHKMELFFDNNPDVKKRLHETFVMLKVNVSDENKNTEFLKAFPKNLGYPHMYVAEKDGSVLYSKDTAEFLQNGSYQRKPFMKFFDRWAIEINKDKL